MMFPMFDRTQLMERMEMMIEDIVRDFSESLLSTKHCSGVFWRPTFPSPHLLFPLPPLLPLLSLLSFPSLPVTRSGQE